MVNIFMITDPKPTDRLTQFYVDVKQKDRIETQVLWHPTNEEL